MSLKKETTEEWEKKKPYTRSKKKKKIPLEPKRLKENCEK